MANNYSASIQIIGGEDKLQSDLYFYRIILVIAAVLIPVFGLMYLYTDPQANDTMIYRYILSAMYLSTFVLSFNNHFIKKHISTFVYLLHGCMFIWLPLLLYANNLLLDYVLGYIMAFSAVLLTFRNNKALIIFIVYGFGASVLLAYLVKSPHISPLIFAGSVGTIALVLYFAVGIRNDMQTALHSNEELLKTIFNEAADAVILAQRSNFKITDCNDRALQFFNSRDRNELKGKLISDLYADPLLFKMEEVIKDVESKFIWTEQAKLRKNDSESFWGDIAIRFIRSQKGNYLLVRITNISKLKKYEEEIINRQQQFESAQQLVHLGSWEWHINSNKLLWSDELYRMYGLVPGDIEMNYELYTSFLHPDDRENIQSKIAESYTSKKPFEFEHRIIRVDGGVRYHSSKGEVFCDDSGNPVKMIGTAYDVTELKKTEKKLTDFVQELESTNKELNRFAYIVSHDLKAPLRAIGSLVSWLTTDYKDKLDDKGKEHLQLLEGRVKRMHELIDAILYYSHIPKKNKRLEEVNLNELIKDVIKNSPSNIIVHVDDFPVLKTNKEMIQQLFTQLFNNAVRFSDKDEGKVEIHVEKKPDEYLFSVKDNGPGIEEAYYDKVFEIFQTLQPRDIYESVGIGLPIAKKIVESFNGRIWLDSEVGKGTTVYFTLPEKSKEIQSAVL